MYLLKLSGPWSAERVPIARSRTDHALCRQQTASYAALPSSTTTLIVLLSIATPVQVPAGCLVTVCLSSAFSMGL
jgi:hypothetical protein